jgi:hypothetical protein
MSERPSTTTASTGIRSPAASRTVMPGTIRRPARGRASRRPDHGRAVRHQPPQPGDRGARALAHRVVERAADEQEEQQRDRGVEIGVRLPAIVS